MMESRLMPKRAVELALAADPRREERQVGAVNARGEAERPTPSLAPSVCLTPATGSGPA
ncbi:MAG: hypothetical protein RXR70_00865 [Acidilobus sp.]